MQCFRDLTTTPSGAPYMSLNLPTPSSSVSGADSLITLSQDSLISSPSPLGTTQSSLENGTCSVTGPRPQRREQPGQKMQQQVQQQQQQQQQQQEKKITGTRKPRTYKYNPKPLRKTMYRSFVPDTWKDQEYWERRQKNNLAVKKSREKRRKKELEVVSKMQSLEQENEDLKKQLREIEAKNKLLEEAKSLLLKVELVMAR